MSIRISPLELILDPQNPRFVILTNRTQEEIRKYLAMYEDVCQLSVDINDYGSLLPGERIVALHEKDQYVVIEGNRRTCCLQMLLNRELIPDGFSHKIPNATDSIKEKCEEVEIDVLSDREEALGLMTKRHIEGVKQWKPLAKKQFFAASYDDGKGQSIQNLSQITGVKQSDIKEDIRDYKFFYSVYKKYAAKHPDFNKEIIVLKTDPFWRLFKAKIDYPEGNQISPKELLRMSYDDLHNTISSLPENLFDQITQLIFEKTIVEETVTTRNKLTEVEGIEGLLKEVIEFENEAKDREQQTKEQAENLEKETGITEQAGQQKTENPNDKTDKKTDEQKENDNPQFTPGGPSAYSFFEAISWRGKLDERDQEHQGLLVAINELYKLSTIPCGRQKAYRTFPVGAGMVLRTAYEQALRLRMKQAGAWGTYVQGLSNSAFPTLSSMEDFINHNKQIVLGRRELIQAYDQVIASSRREFLNANIHNPGNIRVSSDSLEAIAVGGMYSLIQGIIDMV